MRMGHYEPAQYSAHLKKAVREIERSSIALRDEAKMERRTAGVTGMRLRELGVESDDESEDDGGGMAWTWAWA